MKHKIPRLLVAAGIVLFVSGFAYDILFAGIPYQDPSPQMQANYTFHARIASAIQRVGVAALLGGLATGVVRRLFRTGFGPGT
jgi:hypothetical protein